ncbi:MAG: hypothetical protein IPJ42_22385 [Betaproteobacteria bacterium]|nr:hypothetical protein [Betaproteobacteria bacterium]
MKSWVIFAVPAGGVLDHTLPDFRHAREVVGTRDNGLPGSTLAAVASDDGAVHQLGCAKRQ